MISNYVHHRLASSSRPVSTDLYLEYIGLGCMCLASASGGMSSRLTPDHLRRLLLKNACQQIVTNKILTESFIWTVIYRLTIIDACDSKYKL